MENRFDGEDPMLHTEHAGGDAAQKWEVQDGLGTHWESPAADG